MIANLSEILAAKFIEYFNQETEDPSLARFYSYDCEAFINCTPNSECRPTWLNRFKKGVNERNIEYYGEEEPDWEEVQQKLNNKFKASPASTKASQSSRTPTLKTKLTPEEKTELKNIFDTLNPKKFWYLNATISKPNEKPESVEERVIKFALNCNCYHPSQQLILDLSDSNWNGIFTKEEKKEIENANCKLLRAVDKSLVKQFNELYEKETAKEAYNFARRIEHDPEHEPLLAWFSTSVQTTSLLHLKQNKFNIQNYMESDKMYYLWGFINKIFDASEVIVALGKEKCSSANAAATNKKRKLSAVDPVNSLKIGRRTDTTYIGGDGVELGCLEIGKTNDQTKELIDGSIKMPIVMRDMLMELVEESPTLVNELHILGYVIMGNKISLLDMDIPCGYVARVRRTNQVAYPDSSENYTVRIGPLLELAAIGKTIAETTYKRFSKKIIPLSGAGNEEESTIPPRIPVLLSSPSPSATSTVSSSPSSSSLSSNKRRNTNVLTSSS